VSPSWRPERRSGRTPWRGRICVRARRPTGDDTHFSAEAVSTRPTRHGCHALLGDDGQLFHIRQSGSESLEDPGPGLRLDCAVLHADVEEKRQAAFVWSPYSSHHCQACRSKEPWCLSGPGFDLAPHDGREAFRPAVDQVSAACGRGAPVSSFALSLQDAWPLARREGVCPHGPRCELNKPGIA